MRRSSRSVASLGASALLIATSVLAMGGVGGVAHAKQAQAPSCATQPPPAVPNASAAKKYKGQTITYYGDSVGCGHDLDVAAVRVFTKATGIKINLIEKPQLSDQNLAAYARIFNAHSDKMDVMMLDVVWPGTFAADLVNLKSAFKGSIKQYYSGIIKNDTVKGNLIAIPWFGDFGMLYYRTDLLKKYGYSRPPSTWTALDTMAKKIQSGEQKSNKSFYGFVFQGKAYEGLTCDALEWLASSGGGLIIQNGKVTLNNPNAVKILNQIRGFVGTISPRDVTTYDETASLNAFDNGDAEFMRNWPYAYAVSQKTKIAGKFAAAPLPHGAGHNSVGTVGGWQLGVSKFSKHVGASEALVAYLASPQMETWRAIVGSFVPTIPSVASKASVIKAEPFLKDLQKVKRVTRPATPLGTHYNQGSTIFFQAVNQILTGQDASAVLPQTAQQLQRVLSS